MKSYLRFLSRNKLYTAIEVVGRWLEGYVIRTDNSPVIYAGALALVLIVVLATILLQALHMMRTNPAEALKKE